MQPPIRPALLASVAAAAVALLPSVASATEDDHRTIVVEGQRVSDSASAATKSVLPMVETAQSISLISREDIDAQGVANLNQVLRYVAGVTPETRGANGEYYDEFRLRGFVAPRYLDGLKVFASPTGYADAQIDLSRLERIEIVKGPASVLYGQSSPGGLVAMSSKLPDSAQEHGSLSAAYGTFDLFRLDGDVGGKLGERVLYRVSGSINGANTQQSFGTRRRYTISPAVLIGAGSGSTLTVLGNISHDPFNGIYGLVPYSGSAESNPNGRIAQDFADGEPALQRFSRDQKSITYIAEHRFGNGWKLRASGRFQDVRSDYASIYVYGTTTDPAQALFSRGAVTTAEHMSNWTFDHQLSGTAGTGRIVHNLLFGLDYQTGRSAEGAGYGTATAINAFAPVYGTTTTLPVMDTFSTTARRQLGLYAQDMMAIGGLRLTASGRYDWASSRLSSVSPTATAASDQTDRHFSYRLAALYRTGSGLAPYASYSTSFEPQSSTILRTSGSTGIADPSIGRQIEVGVKYQPRGTPILLTAALFHIDQSNVVVSNPLTFLARQSGKVRSQGAEVEAKAPLGDGLTITASYSGQKVRTIHDDNAFNLGHAPIGVGKSNGGLFLDYAPHRGSLAGVTLGGGVRHVGQIYGGYVTNDAGTAVDHYVETPGYTLFDAALGYELGMASRRLAGMRLVINAANLFDKRTLSSCYVDGLQWCWYGQRRTVQATLGYHW